MGEKRKRRQKLRNVPQVPQIPRIRVPPSASDTALLKVRRLTRGRRGLACPSFGLEDAAFPALGRILGQCVWGGACGRHGRESQ